MPAVYVVHSRVIALCERPFYYQNPLRAAWKDFFEDDCRSHHLQAADPQVNKGVQAQPSQQRFISGVGALRLRANRMQSLRMQGAGLLAERYTDRRMRPLHLEFSHPIPLRSRGRDDARAWGNFYVHIYPSGYLVVHLALTLSWQRERSMDGIAALIAETYPGRAGSAWRWRSRIGRGRIHNLYLRLRTYLYSSFFEGRRTMLREGQWKTVVKHCDLLVSEQLAASLWPGETHASVPIRSSLLRSILFASQGAILHLCNREGRCGRRLACFWRMMQLYEQVLLEEQIHADYFSALLGSLHRLIPALAQQPGTLDEAEVLRRMVLDRRIPEYLSCLVKQRELAGAFCAHIQAAFAFWFGLAARQAEALRAVQSWEAAVQEAGAHLPAAWPEICAALQSVLTAYEPIDPDWIMAQRGEAEQCLLWLPGR